MPILYLIAYIIKNKSRYYELLENVSKSGEWSKWVEYMLNGIERTAEASVMLIKEIDDTIREFSELLQEKERNVYSKDFVELLFSYPYTKIESVDKRLNISRQTASKYLKICEKLGAFKCVRLGRINYFVNLKLFEILQRGVVL